MGPSLDWLPAPLTLLVSGVLFARVYRYGIKAAFGRRNHRARGARGVRGWLPVAICLLYPAWFLASMLYARKTDVDLLVIAAIVATLPSLALAAAVWWAAGSWVAAIGPALAGFAGPGAAVVMEEATHGRFYIQNAGAALLVSLLAGIAAWQILATGGFGVWAVIAAGRRPASWACPACGYDLRGVADDRCPECGEPREPRAPARDDPDHER